MTKQIQQTAVEWYADKFSEHLEENYGIKITNLTLLKKAKQKEKERIINAYKDGNYDNGMGRCEPEQYYKETDGGNK
jgi:hypothetical protein